MTDYLLLPMQPTPNGRMHIGHGGGTYLRADMVARFLRSRGHDVRIVTGSDAHENWVLAESASSGLAPQEVCRKYHSQIADDLASLQIQLDSWIDPLSDEHVQGYTKVHEDNLQNLRDSGAAVLEAERVPVSATTGEVMMGTWIAGQCPTCGADAGGSSCVLCGDHFQPEELIAPRSRLDDSPLTWDHFDSWFAHPIDLNEIEARVRSRGMRDAIAAPALRYLESKGGRVRLSGAGSWGIATPTLPAGAILMNSYYLYAVYGAETYRRARGLPVSPMHPSSQIVTVGFFGSDNTTPGVIVPEVLAQGSRGELRPFDFTVVNGMLNFEGQKCSTSKRHGIWLSEILGSRLISSDELRFALSHAALDFGADDISVDEIVDHVNYLREVVVPVISSLFEHGVPDELGAHVALDDALDRQERSFSLSQLDTRAAVTLLREWVGSLGELNSGQWLVGVALLGSPIIPDLARRIWRSLGLKGDPATAILSPTLHFKQRDSFGEQSAPLGRDSLLPFAHRAAG